MDRGKSNPMERPMQDENAINRPGADVTIDVPHRGDIRCRVLTISRSGSLFGNVLAEEVRVAGRFDGTAHSTRFYTVAGSKVFGAVYAAVIGIKPGTALHAHMGPEFPVPQQFSPALAKSTEEAILRGIEQGARLELSRRVLPLQAQTAGTEAALPIETAAVPMTVTAPSPMPALAGAAPACAPAMAAAARQPIRKALPSII